MQPKTPLRFPSSKRAVRRILVDGAVAHRPDERDELPLEVLEDPLRLGRRQPLLVVVEEDAVRVVVGREALDVAPLQLELPLDVRAQDLEVAPLACLEPRAAAASFPGPTRGATPSARGR